MKQAKQMLVALGLVLAAVVPARGQGTPMPVPLIQWFDNAGGVFSDGGLCVFVAGSSTLATTYTTAALSVANANPVEFDSAGRPTSGGVWLTPGSRYKFVLKNFAGVVSPTCVPDTGVTIWTVDNVPAVPTSAASVDVTATAGESLAAGEVVYLSTGTGSLNAGQWYRTDADLTYRSTQAAMVGVAPNAITSGNSGSVRIMGAVTTSGLVSGAIYYASGTIGAMTTTPPTNAIRIGQASSATVLIVGYTSAPIGPRHAPCGRLTLTTDTPVTIADVTAATTLYFSPYGGCNTIYTYDGTAWNGTGFAQLSIAVPATTNQMYDVFVLDSTGVLTLELTAWTNDTTRAIAIIKQNSVWVKDGSPTRLYLGSFRTTGVSGQTEDSFAKRYVWNYYNRVPRLCRIIEATNSWAYTTATFRQANASTANQLDVVVGVAEVAFPMRLVASVSNDGGGVALTVAIGQDSTTTPVSNQLGMSSMPNNQQLAAQQVMLHVDLVIYPAVGRHFYVWLEKSGAAGVTTWYGDATLAGNEFQAGMQGVIQG